MAVLFPSASVASSATLTIEPFSIEAGETKEMMIDLTNPEDELTLVQFDLRLPAGLSIKESGGEYDMDMCDRTSWRRHSLDANATNGTVRFLLASSSNTAISGTSGAIIKMTLVAEDGFTNGTIRLENILLVSPDEKETKPADYELLIGKSEEPVQTSAYLSIEPFSIGAGETKEMMVDLTNPDDELTLVQFDLRLPAGLSIKESGGEYDMDMCDRTSWRKHSLDANATNGIVRFMLASSSNTVISGTSGAIVKVKLSADNSYRNGQVRLENILLVTPDEKEIKPADVIGVPTGIAGIRAEGQDNDTVFSLSGQRLTAPRKGVNIVGGRKVVVR